MKSHVLLGGPELERLANGKPVTIRLKPDTTELEITLSSIAKGRLNPGKDTPGDMLKKIMGGW